MKSLKMYKNVSEKKKTKTALDQRNRGSQKADVADI